MSGLTEDKQKRIEALLGTLPGDMADRLCATAVKADPALGRLMTLCRDGLEATARDRLFEPLAPVSGDPETDPPSKAYTPAKLLAVLWSWLDETQASDLTAQVKDAVLDTDAEPGDGQLDPLRIEIANAIMAGIDAVKDDPKAQKKLKARLGVSDFEAVMHAAVILRSSPSVRSAMDGIPDTIPEMTDNLSATIRDRYEAASESDPDAAVWLLFLLMTRMDRPWRILRVFERIARREDDLLISQTDMATIGDSLLADAAFELRAFAVPPDTPETASEAAAGLARFAAVTVGMTREIGIRKDGDWGKQLFELRSKASDQMVQIHQAARDAFWKATPEGGGLKRRVFGTPTKPGEPDFIRAEALGSFLIATKDDASRAAVGNAHNELIADIRDRLEAVSQELLAGMRSASPEEADAGEDRLGNIAQLMTAIGQREAATILLRRVAAALAA